MFNENQHTRKPKFILFPWFFSRNKHSYYFLFGIGKQVCLTVIYNIIFYFQLTKNKIKLLARCIQIKTILLLKV